MNERSNDMLQSKKQSVFLVGAKSLGNYGGYETFVDKLTEYHQNNTSIKYYVACKANGDGCIDEKKLTDIKRNSDNEFTYHNAICFKINIPNIGPAQLPRCGPPHPPAVPQGYAQRCLRDHDRHEPGPRLLCRNFRHERCVPGHRHV